MIFHDKNGKYPIVCSFCGAEEECEHLFALFNRNRGEIEKGTIKTHFDDIKTFIQEQLITFISKNNITVESPFLSEKLNEIWYDIFCSRNDFFSKNGLNRDEFKSFIENISLTEYIMECIDSTEIGEVGISISDQPGNSESFEIFHIKDKSMGLSKLLDYIKEDIGKSTSRE